MLDIEVLGAHTLGERAPATERVRRLCVLAAAAAGVSDGHLAIEFVDSQRIAQLNEAHRGKPAPTDVLSFPIDGASAAVAGVRELGDVVICPEHTVDLYEAIAHGVLHLVGMDHEVDRGEMLAVQAELLRWERLPASAPSASAFPAGAPPKGASPTAAPPTGAASTSASPAAQ